MSPSDDYHYREKLNSIEGEVFKLGLKIDKLLIGEDGQQGLIPRVSRHDEQISSLRGSVHRICNWFLAAVAILVAAFITLFKSNN